MGVRTAEPLLFIEEWGEMVDFLDPHGDHLVVEADCPTD